MKKILFAAFAASLLAAGCQKTEVYQPANSGEKMTFSTEMKKITKVEDPYADGLEVLHEQGFNVWAFADYDRTNVSNVSAGGIFDGMENWYVGYNSESWSANKAFYWPGKRKELHFFAISGCLKNEAEESNQHPAKYDVVITPCFNTTTLNAEGVTESKMTINYTIGKNASDDLMVADFIVQDQEDKLDNVTGKVALNFRHTLSKVQFVFKTPEAPGAPKVYVQKLTVTKLKNTGTLTVKAKSGNTSAVSEGTPVITEVDPKWDTSKATNNTGYEVASANRIKLADGVVIDYVMELNNKDEYVKAYDNSCGDLLNKNDSNDPLVTWLLMPQTLTEDSQIEVFYLIDNRQFKAVFDLKREDVQSWAENTFTKYIITLSPNMITFDATVSKDWEEAKTITDQN